MCVWGLLSVLYIYIYDDIKVFDGNGKFLFKFGARGNEDGEFDWPEGVTVDNKNRIFVVDRNNRCVQVFDAQGKFLSRVGETFNRPHGIAGNVLCSMFYVLCATIIIIILY